MSQIQKATRFRELHVKGNPIMLYNAWDAGSAKIISEAGAKAIGTSSWAVAQAQGYEDGEIIPIGLVEQLIARIMATVDVPVTLDFEGGYSTDDGELDRNISDILDLGVIGINFEDRQVKGSGLHSIERQSQRIAAIRKASDKKRIPLFINARTDVFASQEGDPASSIGEALERARAYSAAGASGLFIPGLTDEALIGRICEGSPLPVNVMIMDGTPSIHRLTQLGVSRISYGPLPYITAMGTLKGDAEKALS
ncbi:MAG: isocitrate lyase/phosphoenolpyruvate mutase family protein [Nitrospira sp.]|nr:isocitrate lyase/phosphoenolpyruvate mutase family protein [Nitrospira sp.]